jgi:hypothetical protein
MLPTTTNPIGEIGSIASTLFGDLGTFITFIIGISLAFYLIEKLIGLMVYEGDLGATADHFLKPRYKGYKWYRSEKWNMEHTTGE